MTLKDLSWDDITKIAQIARQKRNFIERHYCVPPPAGCGNKADYFRDDLSAKEYLQSGLCQDCQDKFFNSQEEE
jgi:hypothetical protein